MAARAGAGGRRAGVLLTWAPLLVAVVVMALALGSVVFFSTASRGGREGRGDRGGKAWQALKGPQPVGQLQQRSAVASAGAARPRHVVFVLADDLGATDTGYYDENLAEVMPVLTGMAQSAGGVVLSRYYSMQRCTPARSALLTGKHPIEIGMQVENIRTATEFGLPLEEATMADAFKAAGYATHGVAKWNQGHFDAQYLPHHRGFDSWFGYMTDEIDYWSHENPFATGYKDFFRAKAGADEIEYVDSDAFSMTAFRDELVDIVGQHDAEKEPLFLYFASQAPHGPLPDTVDLDLLSDTQEAAIASIGADEGVVRERYLQLVGILDSVVGDVVSALKDKNMWEDTLFVFASDNGGCNAQGGRNLPLRAGKTTNFEGGLHVPAFVYRKPWDTKERQVALRTAAPPTAVTNGVQLTRRLVQVTDWLPTLMEAIGQEEVASTLASAFSRSKWADIEQSTEWSADPLSVMLVASDNSGNNGDKDKAETVQDRVLWYSSYDLCCNDPSYDSDYCSVCPASTTSGAVVTGDGFKGLYNALGSAGYWDSYPDGEASYVSTNNCRVAMSGSLDAIFSLTDDPLESTDVASSNKDAATRVNDLIRLAAETEVYPVYQPASLSGVSPHWDDSGFIGPFRHGT